MTHNVRQLYNVLLSRKDGKCRISPHMTYRSLERWKMHMWADGPGVVGRRLERKGQEDEAQDQ